MLTKNISPQCLIHLRSDGETWRGKKNKIKQGKQEKGQMEKYNIANWRANFREMSNISRIVYVLIIRFTFHISITMLQKQHFMITIWSKHKESSLLFVFNNTLFYTMTMGCARMCPVEKWSGF
jgi:hypothetical protein